MSIIIKPFTINTSKGVWQSTVGMCFGYCLLLCVFLLLSLWQVWRAQQVQLQITAQQRLFNAAPIAIEASTISAWETLNYVPVSVDGTWILDKNLLQDNVTLNGIAGYEVITPLNVGSGKVLLVNRGWVPKSQLQNGFGDLNPQTKVFQQQPFTGHLTPPRQRISLQEEQWSNHFPLIMQVMDLQRLGELFNEQVLPKQLRLKEGNVDTFNTQWSMVYGNPHRNYAYALQWLSFATILTFLFWKLNWTQASANNSANSNKSKELNTHEPNIHE